MDMFSGYPKKTYARNSTGPHGRSPPSQVARRRALCTATPVVCLWTFLSSVTLQGVYPLPPCALLRAPQRARGRDAGGGGRHVGAVARSRSARRGLSGGFVCVLLHDGQ